MNVEWEQYRWRYRELLVQLTGFYQRRDPRLGDFVDPRLPGQGRFPLLVNSPAINAGDDCSSVDQLENVRNGQCDIRGQWNFTRWLMS